MSIGKWEILRIPKDHDVVMYFSFGFQVILSESGTPPGIETDTGNRY